ncbi:MAG: serine--tRNA ligase [Candidatus Micrarchaeota archaeon]|nr:serine--tRNA ligase [Candidatus Micrarchaeota archaeon]
MLTAKYFRDHLTEIRESLKGRNSDYPVDEILDLDRTSRELKTRLQELQAQRNKASLSISEMKKAGREIDESVASLKAIKEEIETIESELPSYEERLHALLWGLPNTLHQSVPIGDPPEANKVLHKWGSPTKSGGKNHEEILSALGMLDMERAANTAGARFYYLRGDLVLLEQALLMFALTELSRKGFVPILPPFMLRKRYYEGVAPLAVFQDALYKATEAKEVAILQDYEKLEDELYMISTSEHALAAMHSGEVFSAKDLPLKYAGISPCFRREAGAHGKDTKGIFRVHQFDKVEQFVYCRREDDDRYFDELLANSEELLQRLGLPYQAVLLCSGDTGHQMSRTVDLEAWFPSQQGYRELVSCSSASDWQSLRLDVKYDEGNERKHVFTLNSTGISVERTLVALVENYLESDGTITVPRVLVPFVGKERIGE